MLARYFFTFAEDWQVAPGAFWVHKPDPCGSSTYDPPAPAAVPHQGYPVLNIVMPSCHLIFTSLDQIDHYVDIISRKPLPTTRQLSNESGRGTGPNGHWLSRLPAELKSPKGRESLLKALNSGREFAHLSAPSGTFNRTGGDNSAVVRRANLPGTRPRFR